MPGTDEGIVTAAKKRAQDAENTVNRVDVPMTKRLGLADFGKELVQGMGKHHLGAFAGNLTYSGTFAIFPLLIFVLSLLGLFHATSLLNTMISHVGTAMPGAAVQLLRQINTSITKSHATGAFTVSAIISIVLALWGVSGTFRAVMEAMNMMYGINQDSRPMWKQYLLSIVMSALVGVMLIGSLVLIVAGPLIGGKVAGAIGLGSAFAIAWSILQWPILIAIVLLAFALLYYTAPDVKQKFKFISPGAFGAVILWVVFSLVFSLYVNHFGSYNKTYGALAGIAIFMLYLNYSAQIVLLGGLANKIIEEHAPDSRATKPGARKGKAREQDHEANDDAPRTVQILQESRPN